MSSSTVPRIAHWRTDRIGSALRGQNPTVMARLPGSIAVITTSCGSPGYCVLLSEDPSAQRLSDLARDTEVRGAESGFFGCLSGCLRYRGSHHEVAPKEKPPDSMSPGVPVPWASGLRRWCAIRDSNPEPAD